MYNTFYDKININDCISEKMNNIFLCLGLGLGLGSVLPNVAFSKHSIPLLSQLFGELM